MASTIPAFKAALLARLTTALGDDVQVSWGNPYPDAAGERLVIIGDASADPGQEPMTFPQMQGYREENYSVEVAVSVVGSAQESLQTLLTDAYGIAADIEASLLSWKDSAYDGVVDWALVSAMSDSEGLTKDGQSREAAVTVTVSVSARV